MSWHIQAQTFCYNGDGDNDMDGVRNSLDQCPKTLGGVPVDTHGCPLDTDGDGVPDYLDKELITPTICQPSNEEGIGNCPCPSCCPPPPRTTCFTEEVGWIGFSHLSYKIDPSVMPVIREFANHVRSNPGQVFEIVGYGAGSCAEMQASWSRAYTVRQLLIDSFRIDAERTILKYGASDYPFYLVKLATVSFSQPQTTMGNLPPKVYLPPPPFPGFIDEKNKRIKNFTR